MAGAAAAALHLFLLGRPRQSQVLQDFVVDFCGDFLLLYNLLDGLDGCGIARTSFNRKKA